MRMTGLLALLLALPLALPAGAGIRLQLERRDLSGASQSPEKSELLLQDRRLKMSRPADGSGMGDAILFDAELQKMWVLDTGRRSYLEMDRSRATGDQVESAMSQVQAQMAAQLSSLPPDQRALVEQAMKSRMPAMATPSAAEAEKETRVTEDRAEKQGHPCRRVEIWTGGEKKTDHWVTDWNELGLNPEDLAVFEELGDFLSEIGTAMGGKQGLPDLMQASEEMGGLPVVTIDYSQGRALSETVLVGVERQAIADAELRLPADYRGTAMPGVGLR